MRHKTLRSYWKYFAEIWYDIPELRYKTTGAQLGCYSGSTQQTRDLERQCSTRWNLQVNIWLQCAGLV
jgi:hypothetical protein